MHRLFAALAALLCAAQMTQAATFRLGGDESLGCAMTIEGEIVEGDAVRFRAMLADYVNAMITSADMEYGEFLGGLEHERICLDSPGGSILEAIEMADTLAFSYRVESDIFPQVQNPSYARVAIWRIGTAVPAGARCESSCAILFMAGGNFFDLATSNNVRDPNRVLHVDGRLGFHAPRLVVPDGRYTEETVAQAFGLAIDAIDRLSQRLGRYNFPTSLFERLVGTPSDSMYYVNTVEQAASWHIGLVGTPLIDTPSTGNFAWVCRNLSAAAPAGFDSGAQYTQEGAPADIRPETHGMFGNWVVIGIDDSRGYHTYRPSASSSYPDGATGEGRTGVVEYSEDGCSFAYDIATGDFTFHEYPVSDHGLVVNGTSLTPIPGISDYGWMLFPGYVTLDELSALSQAYPDRRVPAGHLFDPVVVRLGGYCALYDAGGRLAGSGACTAELSSRQRADRVGHAERFAVDWPDGASPDLPRVGDAVLGDWERTGPALAGRARNADGQFEFTAPPTIVPADYGEHSDCYRQISTGQTRCFVFDRVISATTPGYRR